MSYLLDEERLKVLFEAKEKLTKKLTADNNFTKPYSKHLNLIMQEVLRQGGSTFKVFPHTWRTDVPIDAAEAESLIYDGILKAIHNYSPRKGKCKFSSFLWTIIGQQFKNYRTFSKFQKRNFQLVTSLDADPKLEEFHYDFMKIKLHDTSMENLEVADTLNRLNKTKEPHEKKILSLLQKNTRPSEISRKLGIPYSATREKIKRYRAKWTRIYHRGFLRIK